MKTSFIPLALSLLVVQSASAATVVVGALTTLQENPGGFTQANAASTLIVLDLSSQIGLAPGMPVQVTYFPEVPIWSMELHAEPGLLELRGNVFYELSLGASTFTVSNGWVAFGPNIIPPPPIDPVGYSDAPGDSARVFTVPWGTDLSAVGLRIIDQSSLIADVSSYLTSSSISGAGGTITTSSVPEPALCALGLIAAAVVAGRRHR